MEKRESAALDRWITGNYGEDQYPVEYEEYDPIHECGYPASDHPTIVRDGRDQVVCPTPPPGDPADYDHFWDEEGRCRSCGKFGYDHEEDDEGRAHCFPWPD